MTARDLYTAALALYPHAGSIVATVTAQTFSVDNSILDVWTVAVSSVPKGVFGDIAYAYGYTPESCMAELVADGERKAAQKE